MACWVLVCTGAAGFQTPAGATPPAFTSGDKQAIDNLYVRYGQSFAARDYPRLAEQLQAPFALFNGTWSVFNTVDAVIDFLRRTRDALDAQRIVGSEGTLLDTRITPLTSDRALGRVIGAGLQNAVAQQRDIVSLNHVAIAVDDFEAASRFYSQGVGFPTAFSFRQPDGSPTLSYFQINQNTFIELMPVTPERGAGFVHFGLEVTNLDDVVKRLRAAGMEVRDPVVSSRTKSRIADARTPQGTGVELLEFGPDSLHRKVMQAWK